MTFGVDRQSFCHTCERGTIVGGADIERMVAAY